VEFIKVSPFWQRLAVFAVAVGVGYSATLVKDADLQKGLIAIAAALMGWLKTFGADTVSKEDLPAGFFDIPAAPSPVTNSVILRPEPNDIDQ
jgi:hypothetical protein